MITLYAAMLVTLGFLIAALIAVVILPSYRRRIERFQTEALKRTLPLTEAEIRADKDRLRANFAMALHRLETKVEEAGLSAARQSVEVNRRDAKIQELTEALADQKMSVEEHENARRVLEQAILDRLPKVEQRLAETRKLLATRDREIKTLAATSAKQVAALDEAAQLNAQQEKELGRLRASLNTRAARNREGAGDSRFDSGIALRTELEALREQLRDQANLIERLQAPARKTKVTAPDESDKQAAETKRLTTALAMAESELAALKAGAGSDDEERRALKDRVASLRAADEAKSTELAKLKAAIEVYRSDTGARADISQKAEIGALQAEVENQRHVIATLRAEVAASQERFSRQALHLHEDLRRRSAGHEDGDGANADSGAKPRLAERIVAPRGPQPVAKDAQGSTGAPGADAAHEQRAGAQLHAVNGHGGSPENDTSPAEPHVPPPLPAAEAAKPPNTSASPSPRRPRLLERISGINKS